MSYTKFRGAARRGFPYIRTQLQRVAKVTSQPTRAKVRFPYVQFHRACQILAAWFLLDHIWLFMLTNSPMVPQKVNQGQTSPKVTISFEPILIKTRYSFENVANVSSSFDMERPIWNIKHLGQVITLVGGHFLLDLSRSYYIPIIRYVLLRELWWWQNRSPSNTT